jgi:hypothetical protein
MPTAGVSTWAGGSGEGDWAGHRGHALRGMGVPACAAVQVRLAVHAHPRQRRSVGIHLHAMRGAVEAEGAAMTLRDKEQRLYRIVRHLGNGGREVLIEGLAMSVEQVEGFNREHVRGMFRCWPITEKSPMRRDDQ